VHGHFSGLLGAWYARVRLSQPQMDYEMISGLHEQLVAGPPAQRPARADPPGARSPGASVGARRPEFLAAVRASRRLHGAWVSPPATTAAYRVYLRRLQRPTHAGYFVCRRDSNRLVGVVNVSEIVREAFRSAFLGYYAFSSHAGQGLMTEGLARAILREAWRGRV
jgi:ribosomal-protein-alanine N-acetyltransferase